MRIRKRPSTEQRAKSPVNKLRWGLTVHLQLRKTIFILWPKPNKRRELKTLDYWTLPAFFCLKLDKKALASGCNSIYVTTTAAPQNSRCWLQELWDFVAYTRVHFHSTRLHFLSLTFVALGLTGDLDILWTDLKVKTHFGKNQFSSLFYSAAVTF